MLLTSANKARGSKPSFLHIGLCKVYNRRFLHGYSQLTAMLVQKPSKSHFFTQPCAKQDKCLSTIEFSAVGLWINMVTAGEKQGSSICYAVFHKLTPLMMTLGLIFKLFKINYYYYRSTTVDTGKGSTFVLKYSPLLFAPCRLPFPPLLRKKCPVPFGFG